MSAPDATGTDSTNQTVQATSVAEPVSTSLGTYFAGTDEADNELVIVQPGRPIQPKQVTDISVEGQVAKGAIVTGMESTYQVVTDPVIASPTFVGGASIGRAGLRRRLPHQPDIDHDLHGSAAARRPSWSSQPGNTTRPRRSSVSTRTSRSSSTTPIPTRPT